MTSVDTMTEAAPGHAVRELAAWLGIRHACSARNSKRGIVTSRGYPGPTIAARGGALWRELKTSRGRLTREQAGRGPRADHRRATTGQSGAIGRQLAAIADHPRPREGPSC